MAGPLIGMVKQIAGVMVGGQALGILAKEITDSADAGLLLALEGVGALLPAGVTVGQAGIAGPPRPAPPGRAGVGGGVSWAV